MPAAGFCFACHFLFNVAPLIWQRMGGSQRRFLRWNRRWKRDYGYKIGELRSRDVAMTINFVALDGDKLAFTAFIVFFRIFRRLGRSQNLHPYWPAILMENGKVESIRTPKPLNRLSQNMAWVIMAAMWPSKPKFKPIAPVRASRQLAANWVKYHSRMVYILLFVTKIFARVPRLNRRTDFYAVWFIEC